MEQKHHHYLYPLSSLKTHVELRAEHHLAFTFFFSCRWLYLPLRLPVSDLYPLPPFFLRLPLLLGASEPLCNTDWREKSRENQDKRAEGETTCSSPPFVESTIAVPLSYHCHHSISHPFLSGTKNHRQVLFSISIEIPPKPPLADSPYLHNANDLHCYSFPVFTLTFLAPIFSSLEP